MLIKEIQDDQEMLESEDETQQKTFISAASKFGAKTLPIKAPEVVNEDLVRKAAANLTNAQAAVESEKPKESKKSNKPLEVTFDVKEDLKPFKQDKKKSTIISVSKEDKELRNLFLAGEDEEEALEQFEKDKEQEIENEVGAKVKVPQAHRGWNEWAGEGI